MTGKQEALGLARAGAGGHDHRPPPDADLLQRGPLVGVEVAARRERAARGEVGELGREPQVLARLG